MAQLYEMSVLTKYMQKGMSYEDACHKIPVKSRSPWMARLWKYSPFLDANTILHIGRRLEHDKRAYSHKHPALLPQRYWLTKLYVTKKHEELNHFGADAVFFSSQQNVVIWVVGHTGTL